MAATKTQIKYHGWHDVVVDGNVITGDTFACKDFIKGKLGGKWDGTRKGWVVDADKLAKHTSAAGTIGSW